MRGTPGAWGLCTCRRCCAHPALPTPPLSPINQALYPCPYILYTPDPSCPLYCAPTPNLAHCTPYTLSVARMLSPTCCTPYTPIPIHYTLHTQPYSLQLLHSIPYT